MGARSIAEQCRCRRSHADGNAHFHDKIAQEQLTILFRQVQTTKATKAQELLAKRGQSKEK